MHAEALLMAGKQLVYFQCNHRIVYTAGSGVIFHVFRVPDRFTLCLINKMTKSDFNRACAEERIPCVWREDGETVSSVFKLLYLCFYFSEGCEYFLHR